MRVKSAAFERQIAERQKPVGNIKFKLRITNTANKFGVSVFEGKKKVVDFGWYGGFFMHGGKEFFLKGPYYGEQGDKFRVYELSPVSELS